MIYNGYRTKAIKPMATRPHRAVREVSNTVKAIDLALSVLSITAIGFALYVAALHFIPVPI